MSFLIQHNEPDANKRLVYFWLVQSNGTSVATTEATNRPQWSLNGSAFTGATNTLSAVSANGGRYSLQLTQSETSVAGSFILRHSSATCFEQGNEGGPVQIVRFNPFVADYVSSESRLQGGTTSAISLGSGETSRDDWFNGGFVMLEYANGNRIGAVISDYTGATFSAQLQSILPLAPASTTTYILYPGTPAVPLGDVWNTPTSSYSTSGTFGQALLPTLAGSAQSGRNSGISLPTTAVQTNDYYNFQIVKITKGTGAGQSRIISDYTGATFSAEVNGNWAVNPDSTSEVVVTQFGAIPGASAPTAAENATATWEYASGRTVDSVTTVQGIASAASVQPRPGTYSDVSIGASLRLDSSVSLRAATFSGTTLGVNNIAPATYSGVSVEVFNAAGDWSGVSILGVQRLNSSVTLRAATHSGATVAGVSNVVAVLAAGRQEIANSLLSTDMGNSRLVQQAFFAIRNRVQTDPASSTITVFAPDDTTSSWTGSITTSTVAITGFNPQG